MTRKADTPHDFLRQIWQPGDWWACDYPERPPTGQTHYKFDCDSCLIAAQVRVAMGDNPIGESVGKAGRIVRVPLSKMVDLELERRNNESQG